MNAIKWIVTTFTGLLLHVSIILRVLLELIR